VHAALTEHRNDVRQLGKASLLTDDLIQAHAVIALSSYRLPWLRRLLADFSLRRTGLDPMSVNVEFVVDIVTVGHVFIRVLLIPLSVIFYRCSVVMFISSTNEAT
jgi:hypothetical protein